MKKKKHSKLKIVWSLIAAFFAIFAVGMSFLSSAPTSYAASNINISTSTFTGTGSYEIGTWTWKDGTLTGTISASSSTSCFGDTTYTAQTSTITITNTGTGGIFMFDYSLSLNNGSCKIDNVAKTANGTYSKANFNNGSSMTISLTSAKASGTTKITITDLKVTSEHDITVTLYLPSNTSYGSYKYNNTKVTKTTTLTIKSTAALSVVATPATGKRFLCWLIDESEQVHFYTPSYSFYSEDDYSIRPVFEEDLAVWAVGDMTSSTTYTNFNDAISAASNKTIYLVLSGELRGGNYTIPSGTNVVIPCNASGSAYTDSSLPKKCNARKTLTVYKSLSLLDNASITFSSNSKLYVPCEEMVAYNTGKSSVNGCPSGTYGLIKMSSGTKIIANSGATIYCWGFISGEGNVIANSGATVWEFFQNRCWRGGTASSSAVNSSNISYKVFPFNQYYVQNIEAYLTIEKGATENIMTGANAASTAYYTTATFISTSSGMFRITEGSVTKKYDGPTDRLLFTVDDDSEVSISYITISISIISVNSADFVLPLNSNVSIDVKSGSIINVSSNQDLCLMPGSIMNVEDGATINIASKLYLYDSDQWDDNYAVADAKLNPVGFSIYNGTKTVRTADSLIDAELNINGTLNISGALYTTASGANLHSSNGTGIINYIAAAGTDTATYQLTQNNTTLSYHSISITSAKLRNENPEFATRVKRDLAGNPLDANGNIIQNPSVEDLVWEPGSEEQLEYVSTNGVPANYHFEVKNEKYEITENSDYNDEKYRSWVTVLGTATKNIIEYYPDKNFNSDDRLFSFSYIYNEASDYEYTFKTGDDFGFEKAIIKWISDTDASYLPGESYKLPYLGKIKVYPQYAGWGKDGNNDYLYLTPTTYATGLFRLTKDYEKLDSSNNVEIGEGEVCYFSTAGVFMKTFTGVFKYDSTIFGAKGDNNYYFIENGVVDFEQGVKSTFDADLKLFTYYYVDSDGFVAMNKMIHVSAEHSIASVPKGWYKVDSTGAIIICDVPTTIDENNFVYDSVDNICFDYGLFELNGHLYYCLSDGKIAIDATVYVTKTNGFGYQFSGESKVIITEGLYYFDGNGYMYSSDFRMITQGITQNG